MENAGVAASPERRYPVAVSAEQLALGWLRSEGAPNGAVVTVDHEIGARQRLGIPWRVPAPRSFSCAVVLRCALALEDEALLWIASLVAAARAVEGVGVPAPGLGWPDLLFGPDGTSVGSITLEAQLGPGIVQSAVVALRLDAEPLATTKLALSPIGAMFSAALTSILEELKTSRADLLSEYDERSSLIGRRVRVRLLPRGDTRGTVGPVTGVGCLPLASPSGMIETLDASTVLSLTPV